MAHSILYRKRKHCTHILSIVTTANWRTITCTLFCLSLILLVMMRLMTISIICLMRPNPSAIITARASNDVFSQSGQWEDFLGMLSLPVRSFCGTFTCLLLVLLSFRLNVLASVQSSFGHQNGKSLMAAVIGLWALLRNDKVIECSFLTSGWHYWWDLFAPKVLSIPLWP